MEVLSPAAWWTCWVDPPGEQPTATPDSTGPAHRAPCEKAAQADQPGSPMWTAHPRLTWEEQGYGETEVAVSEHDPTTACLPSLMKESNIPFLKSSGCMGWEASYQEV